MMLLKSINAEQVLLIQAYFIYNKHCHTVMVRDLAIKWFGKTTGKFPNAKFPPFFINHESNPYLVNCLITPSSSSNTGFDSAGIR